MAKTTVKTTRADWRRIPDDCKRSQDGEFFILTRMNREAQWVRVEFV